MHVTPEWMQMMARYNVWQNDWMVKAASGLSDADRQRDRGAFFGGISRTLNHLLWADLIWMSRFDGGEKPSGGIGTSGDLWADWEGYCAQRATTDQRIIDWADGLTQGQCRGEISWYSGAIGQDMVRNRSHIFTHFFNHQTHHRGQVHAMLTAAGAATSDTDLAFMELS